MKKRNLLSLLLLTGLLASCGVTVQDSSDAPAPSSSETSSEHDHSHEGDDSSEGGDSSHHGGDSSSEEEDPCAHGHTLTHYLGKEATCTELGYVEAWYCNECSTLFLTKPEGTVKESEKYLTTDSRTILPALGHKFPDSYTVVTDPDCTTNGLQTRECETCGFVEEKVVPKLNHDYDEAVYNWDITNKKLTATRHCAHGHDETETVDATLIKSVPGTCTTTGTDTYRSKAFSNRAFERQEYNVTTPIKHTLTYHKANEATCNTHGNTAYYECTGGCGKFYADSGATIEIALNSWVTAYDADNHLVLDDVIAKNPTCSSVGYNAHKICPSCGVRVGYEEIPMTAHTVNTKVWGAYDSAKHYRLCKDCDAKLTETGEVHRPDHEAPYPTDEDVRCLDCGYLIQAASGSAHKHVLEYVPRQEATCTSTGYVQYYACQCGEKFADELGTEPISDPEVIPMKNHNLEHHEAHANNCTVDGNSEYYRCKDCNKFFSDSAAEHEISENSWVIPATGHHPDDVWHTDATYHWHECTSCHDVSSKAAHTLSHNLDDELYEDAITCTVCSYQIRAARHVHKNHLTPHAAVDATCTTAGSSLYYSCTCGHYFADANALNEIEEDSWVISASGHDHLNHFDEVPATCVSTGTKEYYSCSVCGAKQLFDGEHYNVISSDDELVIAKNPDNHIHLENHEAKATTCTEAGYDAYVTCIHNGEAGHTDYSTQTNIPALGHDYAGDYYSNSTGHWQKCTRCGGNGALTAHTPTTDGDGNTVCSVCNYLIASIVPHSCDEHLTPVAAVAATCTTDGNSAYHVCECGKYYSDASATSEIAKDSWVIKAHHTYVPHAGTAATCTSTGIKDYFTCSECSKIFVEDNNHNKVETTEEGLVTPINPTNHASTPTHVNAVEANCAHAGNIEHYHCESCGKYYENAAGTIELLESQVIIPKTNNHTYGAWAVTTAPTCTTAGEESRTCSTCGKVETRVVEALGHAITHHPAQSPTCTEKGNVEYWHCTRCDKYYTNSALTQEVTQSAVEIPALDGGHEWVVDTSVGNNGFTFATDGKTAIVNLKCTRTSGETHTITSDEVVVTSEITTPATCTTKGVTTYTATYGGVQATTTRTDVNALEHDWEFVDITFSANGKTAIVNYVCKNDANHTSSIAADVADSVKTAATCTTKGTTTYTASVDAVTSLDGQVHEASKDVQDIEALGHNYVFDGFTFSADGKTATANYHCSHDATDIQTVNATITSAVKVAPTCTEGGTTTWIATVQTSESLDNTAHRGEKDVNDLEALGHNYITTYKWTSGTTAVVRTDTCYNSATPHSEHPSCSDVAASTTLSSTGMLSELAMDVTRNQSCGDINIHFSNYDESSGKKVQGASFDTTTWLHVSHTGSLDALKDAFFIKVDNSYYYGTSWNSGSSYVIIYPNMTGSVNGGYSNLSGVDTYNNKLSASGLSTSSEFYSDFIAFAKDCDVIIHIILDKSTYTLTIEITYNPTSSTYSKYVGYKQTYITNISSDDLDSYNYVNSVRISRALDTSSFNIQAIEYSANIDRDIFKNNVTSYKKSGIINPWYPNAKATLIDVSGKDGV